MEKLYNPEFKERFITNSVFAKASQNAYRYVLSKASVEENRLGKDLSNFTHKEYDILLSRLKAMSESSIQYQHSILSNYITFAIQNGFSNQTINYANSFSREMLNNYIDKIYAENKIISKDDLDDIITLCENMQDATPIVLMYHTGVSGDMEELRNLKGDDVFREEGYIVLTRDNGDQRKVYMEDKYLEVLIDAYEEIKYQKNNGTKNPNAHSFEFELEEGEYILRNVKRKDNFDGKMSSQAIRQRLRKVASWWGNKFITPTSIMISGMMEYARKYMLENNKKLDDLDSSDYKTIIAQFGIDEQNWFTNKKRILQHLKS